MHFLRLLGRHLAANVVGYLALALALSGGAYAAATAQDGPAPGQNSVGSLDIINNQVLNSDLDAASVTNAKLANNSVTGGKVLNGTLTATDVAQGSYINVAPNPRATTDPCTSGTTAVFCGVSEPTSGGAAYWGNYANGYQPVRYYKDISNQVHLEGLARNEYFKAGPIFILPPGYRPEATEIFAVTCGDGAGDVHARIDVKASGAVRWENHDDCHTGSIWFSLSAITFRAHH